MKAAFIEKPGVIVIRQIPRPEVKPDEVLIKVKESGICGTDIHIFHGDYVGSYPVIPGHEFSGIVEEVGSRVTRFSPGDHVAVEPNIACDNCSACLENRQNFCENWDAVGVLRPGGMAEFTAVPEKTVFPIGSLSFESGAFMEPLSCVLHGVQKVGFKLADRVLVIGAGPIGILLTKSILEKGASSITQIDKNPARLALAADNGASHTFSSFDAIEKDEFDVVVDATGVPALMEKTLQYVRYGGKILLFGVPPQEAEIHLPAFPIFRKGLTILSSFTSVRNSLQAVRLLESGKIDVSRLVSHKFKLEDLAKGINTIEQGHDGVMKVLIEP